MKEIEVYKEASNEFQVDIFNELRYKVRKDVERNIIDLVRKDILREVDREAFFNVSFIIQNQLKTNLNDNNKQCSNDSKQL